LPPLIDEAELKERLASVGAAIPDPTFQALLTDRPTIEHLRRFVLAMSMPRYGDDLLADAWPVRVLARRILQTAVDLASRAAALEVLSDLESGFRSADAPHDPRAEREITRNLFERARDGKDISGILPVAPAPAPAVSGRNERGG